MARLGIAGAMGFLWALAGCDPEPASPGSPPNGQDQAPPERSFPLDEKTLLTAKDLDALELTPHPHLKERWAEFSRVVDGWRIRATCEEGDLEIEVVALADADEASRRCDEQAKEERGRKAIADAKPGGTSHYEISAEPVVGDWGWASSFLRKEGSGTAKVAFRRGRFFAKAIWSAPADGAAALPAIRAKAAAVAGRLAGRLQ
jgi:hypothetical protein